jgi:hypothetical protein
MPSSRAGVFIKALAALARPVELLLARADALLALEMESARGFRSTCTHKYR